MSARPLVSCIMPAYNYERYIARAIDSALAQDYPADRLEVIVVDDGSTDGTAEIAAAYGDRIRLIRKPNGGINSAVNVALEAARGTYIAFLDADDEWPPHKTSRQVDHLERHPEVGLLHGDMEVVDEEGKTKHPSLFVACQLAPRRGRVFGELLRRNFISGGAIMMRSDFHDRYFPLADEAAWTDWWFAARIAPVAQIDHLDEPLYRYRHHGDNTLLGATGERLTRIQVERDLPWRRWLLHNVAPGEAGVAELIEAYTSFEQHVTVVGHRSGHSREELLPVDDARRAAAAAALGEARAAVRRRDPDALACHLVHALAQDPHSAAAAPHLRMLVRAVNDARVGLAGGAAAIGLEASAALEEARSFRTLVFAHELLEEPSLLRAYGEAFGADDDATLVVHPGSGPAGPVLDRLEAAVAAAGLDGERSADLLALAPPEDDRDATLLAGGVHAVLSNRPPAEPFTASGHFTADRLRDLRELAELYWSVVGVPAAVAA